MTFFIKVIPSVKMAWAMNWRLFSEKLMRSRIALYPSGSIYHELEWTTVVLAQSASRFNTFSEIISMLAENARASLCILSVVDERFESVPERLPTMSVRVV